MRPKYCRRYVKRFLWRGKLAPCKNSNCTLLRSAKHLFEVLLNSELLPLLKRQQDIKKIETETSCIVFWKRICLKSGVRGPSDFPTRFINKSIDCAIESGRPLANKNPNS